MTPTLIASLTNKLQLNSWDQEGHLIDAPSLSLIAKIEDLPQGTSSASDFRWRDCEPLLEQASALLDRALMDRIAFQTTGEKLATFTLDIKRAIESIAITNEEQNDGRFDTPYAVSSSQYGSLSATQKSLTAQTSAASNRGQALTMFTAQADENGVNRKLRIPPSFGSCRTK